MALKDLFDRNSNIAILLAGILAIIVAPRRD